MKIRINEDSWDDILEPQKFYIPDVWEDWKFDVAQAAEKFGLSLDNLDYDNDSQTIIVTVDGYDSLGFEKYRKLYNWVVNNVYPEQNSYDSDEEDFNEGYNSKHDTRQDSYGKRSKHNIKETFDDEWWEEDKKSEYADQERFEKTEELKENVGVWCWITFVTDGHNLYGITNFKDHVKRYDYDRDEYEGVIEYRIGNPDFGYDNDTDYVDGLMDETADILRPYIKKLYGDVKSGGYEGYWEIDFTYFIFGDWEGYEPATYDYPGDTGYLEWKPGEGEVKVEKKEISERDFQDTISDWDLNPIKM